MADEVLAPTTDEAAVGEAAAAPTRMRTRLARIGRTSGSDPVLEPLFRSSATPTRRPTSRRSRRPTRSPSSYHRGQTRNSGDPYITHPLAVTIDPGRAGMTPPTLCAALLHDTVEDTAYTLDAAARRTSATRSPLLVDGVTKLDKVKYGDSAQAETIRKMIVAMARDIRVLVIKLADRLHNMRTLRFLRQEKQERIARETLEIYAPLAHRLGMNTDQVGARGPRVRHPAPEGLRRDRPAGRRARAGTRRVPGHA